MKNIVAILLIGITFLSNAQTTEREVVSSGGDFYSNSTGQLSITIGEPVVETISGGSNTLTQGFQQTRTTITNIQDYQTDFVINLFPNPTSEFITLTIDGIHEHLTFSLYTMEGKFLFGNEITIAETRINIVDLVKGTYLLRVADNKELMNTYKILKQ
jgi:hypothetical protein